MIKIKNLSKSFGNNSVLKDISLNIQTGEVVAIIGPSGSGKSTLLRTLNLLELPDTGSIQIEDSKVSAPHISRKETFSFRKKSSMVFQQFNLFKQKNALQNVAESLIVVKGINKNEAKKRALKELQNVGLLKYSNFYPDQLSGGQKQRLGIARALATESKLLLLDEPTSALDIELVGEVLNILKKVIKNNPNYTIILVSHELGFVREVASRVLFFENGKIVEDGTPEEVLESPTEIRTKNFLKRFKNII
jgi:ABC-type polar amino acid transport system ATPase subunit